MNKQTLICSKIEQQLKRCILNIILTQTPRNKEAVLQAMVRYFHALNTKPDHVGAGSTPLCLLRMNVDDWKTFLLCEIKPILKILLEAEFSFRNIVEFSNYAIEVLQRQLCVEKGATPCKGVILDRPESIGIVVIGSEGSGKSTLLSLLRGSNELMLSQIRPTVGFDPVRIKRGKEHVTFFDLGGSTSQKKLWENYYHDVHALMYIIDGSIPMNTEVANTRKILSHKYLEEKPVLLIVNKVSNNHDHNKSMLCEMEHCDILGSNKDSSRRKTVITACGNYMNARRSLQEGLDWLLECISRNRNFLNNKIHRDSFTQQLRRKTSMKTRKHTILKRAICETLSSEDKNLYFMGVEVGESYLSNKTNLGDRNELCDKAKQCASLVNYHRVALTIIGQLIAPIQSGERRWSWSELLQYLQSIHEEDR